VRAVLTRIAKQVRTTLSDAPCGPTLSRTPTPESPDSRVSASASPHASPHSSYQPSTQVRTHARGDGSSPLRKQPRSSAEHALCARK
jgi:hypothetical protein